MSQAMPLKSTELLYFTDGSVRQWRAEVLEARPVEAIPEATGPEAASQRGLDSGPYWAVMLDRSAFYPGGGGQPSDRGWIDGRRVVEAGHDPQRHDLVVHYVTSMEPPRGTVECSLDWARRLDLMQQHTGQHILSAVAMRDLGAATVGFHLSEETATVDLAVSAVVLASPEAMERVAGQLEAAACEVVFAGRPVRIHFVRPGQTPDGDAAQAGLELRVRERGPAPKGGETWRVIEVGGLDLSPCGGTHVATTGEIGLITVQRWEKVRDGLRLEFACGWRALAAHGWRRDALRELAQSLSVHERDAVGQALANLEAASTAQRELRALRLELLGHQAATLFDAAEALPGGRVVISRRDELGPEELKALANGVCGRGAAVALLVSAGGGVPRLVFGRSDELGQINSGKLLSETMTRLGGRGGGSPKLAQGGGGDPGLLDAALEWAAGEVRRLLGG